jgi:DNA polymerase III delta subunit
VSLLVISGGDDVLVNQALDKSVSQWTESIERIDFLEGTTGRLLELLRSPSLFGGTRHGVVDHLEASEDALVVLEQYAGESDAVVVACWRGTLRAGPKKRLEAIGTLLTVTVPVKGDVAVSIKAMAKSEGVVLDAECVEILRSRLGSDWGRMESVLSQLGSSGLSTPTAAMIERLCGTTSGTVAVWDVTDAVSRGAYAEALALATQVEPVVLASWVGKETLAMSRIYEEGWNAGQVASELGLHPFRAKKAVAWVHKRGLRNWNSAIAAAGKLDIAAKGGTSERLLSAFAEWISAVA